MSIYSESLGTVYGQLTIIELLGLVAGTRGSHHKVRVRCSCGAEKAVWLADLRRGATVTCGDRSVHRRNADHTRTAFLSIYKHAYQARALKKGLAFDLSEDLFRSIAQQVCHYCGVEPSGLAKSGPSEWAYNGLDRVDSSLGYTADNVVPCCSICNHAKHTMSYAAFTAWLDRVAATRAKRELHCIEL